MEVSESRANYIFYMFRKLLPLFIVAIFLTAAGFGCKGLSKGEQQAIKPTILEFWTVFDMLMPLKV